MTKDAPRIPGGWTLEKPAGWSDIFVLTAPGGLGSATIDFRLRGFRGGAFVLSGKFVGEKLTRSGNVRKPYRGRGWKQVLVDDAVAWLGDAAPPAAPIRSGARVGGTDPCVCGHAPEEHGHDAKHPASTGCTECACLAFEADEEHRHVD